MASYFAGEIVGVKRKAPEVITMVNGYPHVTYPAFDIVGKILWLNPTEDKYEVKVNNSDCILRVSDRDIFKIDYAGESEVFDSILLNDNLSQPYIYLGEFADHVLNKKRETSGFGGFTQLSKKELKYAEADVKAAEEVYVMFNKIPKYSVNDIVIIDKDFSYEYGYSVVVGIIQDVFNHRDTGDVFYHVLFNSGTPRKIFEYEIKAKFDTDRFKDGQSIHKQLLVKMYHTRGYKYLTDKEVLEWADVNFEKKVKALEELNKREFERIAASPIRIEIDDMIKANYSNEKIKKMINNTYGKPIAMFNYHYKKIIFSGPCTIILWKDGTKTIAKASGGEVFDPEKGVAICFMKKMLGHTETNKVLRKASKQYEDDIAENGLNILFDEFIDFYKSNKNSFNHIDQSTIDEVKKVEEEQDD